MIQCLVVHRIGNDFNSWKKVFDTKIDQMQKAGCQSYSTGTVQGDPKNVYVFCNWDKLENFNKFFQTNEMKETVKKSGVIEEPHVTIFNTIDQRSLIMSTLHH